MEKLAIYGGKPLRDKPFPSKALGPSLYGEEELKELADVINSKTPFRHYGESKPYKVDELEKRLTAYIGTKFALAVSSGTAALFCAIAALNIGPGDEVIIPALSWYSLYSAVVGAGALPVFVDIDESLCIDPAAFEKRINEKTKAVIALHLQGGCGNMDEILRIARLRGVKVIEDFAQSFGGEYNGKKFGSMGDISIASFQYNKMISCGEGGAVFTDNEEYFLRAVRYHDLGMMRQVFTRQVDDKSLAEESHSFAGTQYRMSEIHGAVMLAQLEKLGNMLAKCRAYHKKMRDAFAGNARFGYRFQEGDCGITFFMIFKTPAEAGRFNAALVAEGLSTGAVTGSKNLVKHYPVKSKKLVHDKLPPFGKGFDGEAYVYDVEAHCPNTDDIIGRCIAVTIGVQFTEEDIDDIIAGIKKVDANL